LPGYIPGIYLWLDVGETMEYLLRRFIQRIAWQSLYPQTIRAMAVPVRQVESKICCALIIVGYDYDRSLKGPAGARHVRIHYRL
jgi:hypothetical protein